MKSVTHPLSSGASFRTLELAARGAAGRLSTRVAGLTLGVRSVDPTLRLGLDPVRERFRGGSAPADMEVTARFAALPDEAPGELLFDSASTWRLYRSSDGYAYRCASSREAPPYQLAFFDPDFRTGTIHLRRDSYPPGEPVNPLDYPLDELVVNQLLARGRGAELHACGVRDEEGSGYLFVGQSGAGKSTTARLWQRRGAARILSDDRIILRREGGHPGRIRMYGTPWHGVAELAEPESAPLRAVFFLRQAPENRAALLTPAAAAARFMAAGFAPFHDRAALDFTLEFLAAVAGEVPCWELSFRPDAGSVACARDAARCGAAA